ncbi:glycosyltransferase family 32 protein [Acinetobacter shaoyimingii]|uniref:Mannosyltransferase n=1 Tax=Acinetobacter shaoyimingii TaxID=2715164 RepID=A0A6G8RY67_9GAMM|nr:capsular polysaccharide synthesis protein [Acinetobacter shaoyimingii]NHB58718.1 hypothetical protein [Acinetobacter shaoyimingii]QIO06847.1 hypothetical protein G8E00_13305 [Acinetobacter shaoyimingii]
MKILKKIFYQIKYYFMYRNKKRGNNLKIDNYANTLVLNPTSQLSYIPKKIWIYWEGGIQLFVQDCIENIRVRNPEYEVFFLSPENLSKYCDIDFTGLNINLPQHKADLIRLNLLYQHGGIWLDASIIVYEPLDWIQTLIEKNQTEIFAYYRKKNTTELDSPVIENWLLASTQNNPFLKTWYSELLKAIQIGPKQYIKNIRKTMPECHKIFQRMSNPEYLISYVVCQMIMLEHQPSITLIDCDQNAFFYQVKNRWIKEKTLIDMALNHQQGEFPKLIKFAAKERNHIARFYEKGMFFENSLLDFKKKNDS